LFPNQGPFGPIQLALPMRQPVYYVDPHTYPPRLSVNSPTSQPYSSPSGSSSSGSHHPGPNSGQWQTPADYYPQSHGSTLQPSPIMYMSGHTPPSSPFDIDNYRYDHFLPDDEDGPIQMQRALGNRGQLQLFKVVPQVSGHPGQFIPQRRYKPHTTSDRRRYVEDVALDSAITFSSENPAEDGIALNDALRSRVRRLTNRDEPVFEGRGPSVSIRLEVSCFVFILILTVDLMEKI
jgi:hypothetical protein